MPGAPGTHPRAPGHGWKILGDRPSDQSLPLQVAPSPTPTPQPVELIGVSRSQRGT